MNENDNSLAIRQQIVEKTTTAKHILLTIPKNPSVDEMSAAIGMSLLLDKLDKRPSIVFSGSIPPAVKFLEPDKLITQDIDGLRDFIIALSKDKADKLRWKLEDDVVKIYITPYKSALGQADLEFQQGEFNIELVIALGVENDNELDEALQAQGKVLHDATIISVTAGDAISSIGSINWQDKTASSICEMLVTIAEAFGGNLLDEPIATAFLTGIVAKTNRFSNELTTPKLMTMSAQLMSAGANQQLIATNLGTPAEINEGEEADIKNAPNLPSDKKESRDDAEEMDVDHEDNKDESDKSDKPPIEIPKDPRNFNKRHVNSGRIESKSEQGSKPKSEPKPEKTLGDAASEMDERLTPQDEEPDDYIKTQANDRSDSSIANETGVQDSSLSRDDGSVNDTTQDTQAGSDSQGNTIHDIDGTDGLSDEAKSNESNDTLMSGDGTRHQITEPPEYGGALNATNSQDDVPTDTQPSEESSALMGMTKGVDPSIQSSPVSSINTALNTTVSSPGMSMSTGSSVNTSAEIEDIYTDTEVLVPSSPSNSTDSVADPVDVARQAVLDASHTMSGPEQSSESLHMSTTPAPNAPIPPPIQGMPQTELPGNAGNMTASNASPLPLPPLPVDVNAPLPPLPSTPGMNTMMPPMPAMPGALMGGGFAMPPLGSPAGNTVAEDSPQNIAQSPLAQNDPGTFPLPPQQ